MSAAGIIDPDTGCVLASTEVLRGWAGVPLRVALSRLTGIAVVAVDNDVHAHAAGEAWLGAASKASSAFFVAVGTGIGASIVIEGKIWHGERSVAGHFGHLPVPHAGGLRCVCGGSGHVEAVAAGPAMVSAHNRRTGMRLSSLAEVAVLAEAGSESAIVALDSGARALGCAVGGAVNLLDPSVVVIGGGVVGAGERWWAPMEQSLRAELLPPLRDIPVVPAALGSDAALIGAARLAWKELG
ncbi:ROK family protein [Kribbella sp. GL6]|uniref:ROK family protein n=1 Tax=Kribbella sp. GL6 TaxID=3419765 RepID=UPI003D06C587